MLTQTRSKILVIIIAVLLLINIGMVVFTSKCKDKTSLHNDLKAAMPQFLQTDVGFSSQQMKQYDSVSATYNTKFKKSMESLRKSRQAEFKKLAGTGFSDASIDSIALTSTEDKRILEVDLLQYTKAVRQLCTSDQQPKFDSLLSKVLNKKN